MAKRIITTDILEEDVSSEKNLRPQTLEQYIGQEKAKENLKVYIEAAKQRGDTLDHVLFYGPPGLGKTTLAGIIANEMGVNIKITSGPAIEKPGEMAAILNNLQEGDVLFVDEIHRLNRQVEEVLYPAMEDYAIDIVIGKGASARSIRLDLPKFTLVGATTRAGLLTAPLRDRFGVVHHLEFYTEKELQTIIMRSADVLNVEIDPQGAAGGHVCGISSAAVHIDITGGGHGDGGLLGLAQSLKLPVLVEIAELIAGTLGIFQIGGKQRRRAVPQSHLHRVIHHGGGGNGAQSKKCHNKHRCQRQFFHGTSQWHQP